MKADVTFITYILPHYRIRFHELVREGLAFKGLSYQLIYSDPVGNEKQKRDTVDLPWAQKVPARLIGVKNKGLIWQAIPPFLAPRLVIVGHENRLIASYCGIISARLRGSRVAYFGHGKNFQADNSESLGEKWKQFCAKRVDWWFSYTNGCRDLIAGYGFPADKITVFNNSIDVKSIKEDLQQISLAEQEELRDNLASGSSNIAVYIGGLYAEKRLSFLCEAARRIRELVPDFQLLIIGGGVEADFVRAEAAKSDCIQYLGPKFGREKAVIASLAKASLMPGLVGLGVLDSFAFGTPIVTTQVPYHSPEFEYIQPGRNAVVVQDPDDVAQYAEQVVRLLNDSEYRFSLIQGGEISLQHYSIEKMAERFVSGVIDSLR